MYSCNSVSTNCHNFQKIERVNRVKYLGLIIDCHLRNVHINNLVMRSSSIVLKMYKPLPISKKNIFHYIGKKLGYL